MVESMRLMQKSPPMFHRPELAMSYVDFLFDDPSSASGLFIAAPRRTGKSTFLREDLLPALRNAGTDTIYIDLWADKSREPKDVIESSIREAIAKNTSVLKRIAQRIGTIKVGSDLGSMEMVLRDATQKHGLTLSDLLDAYTLQTQRPLILIIDEAQHALTTDQGSDALFALKAARDLINMSANPRQALRLIFTGSDRDKLSALRNQKDQPFFGAPVVRDFPLLGRDFTDWFCDVEANTILRDVNKADVFKAFVFAGNRPEVLREALSQVRLADPKQNREALFFRAIEQHVHEEKWRAVERIRALSPLPCVVLLALAQNTGLMPFGKEAVERYKALLSAHFPHARVNASMPNIQQALNQLRDKGFFWRADRGDYVLESHEVLAVLSDGQWLSGHGS